MATTFKTFLNTYIVTTKTLLHEAIPITGALVSGTYNKDGSHNDFDLYDWVECKPNSMFSWVVTQQSYHGVPPIAIDGIRDTIAFFGKAKNNWQRRKLYGEDIIFCERK